LQQALYRYKHALTEEIAQSALCNQFHSVQERLARYLLMTGDCAKSSVFHLTHALLARMLGVQRVGITMAAGTLQKLNMIKYSRGKITILDRKRLGAASCGCYRVIRRMYNRAQAGG
jgi:CRP-like cAMP-binding protein